MKLKVIDQIFDYKDAAKKLGIDLIKPNVPMHLVELHIDQWPIELTNSLRYVLFKLYPTVRLKVKIVKCTDLKLFTENVENRIHSLVLSHKCPIKPFKYRLVHNFEFDNPVNLTLSDSSIGKFVNHSVVAVIGKGRLIEIEGDVVESCGVDDTSTNHDFVQAFDRSQSEQYEINGLLYNKGIIKFSYHDDVDGKDVIKKSLKILEDIIKNVKDNIDHLLVENVDTPILNIPRDRSSIIGHCIKHYTYKYGSEPFKQIPQSVIDDQETNSSMIQYRLGSLKIVKAAIILGIDNLLSDITSLFQYY